MKFKGNLSLEWYQKQKSVVLRPAEDASLPAMLNWVNKDGALFYEIDASQARGLRPVWTSASDYRVREARPLEFVRRFEFAGNFMAPECKTIDTPKAPGLPIDENIIIRGDNLLALNTLVAHIEAREETDKVKCIYIDPPYNTGSAFQHYDDNLEHSIWLTMMRDRLILMRRLLREDGVIFVQCDDAEQAYLKIMLDEIFGRVNFIGSSVVRRRKSQANLSKNIAPVHDIIHIYSKSSLCILNSVFVEYNEYDFQNNDNDPRGSYVTMPCSNKGGSAYEITTPKGVIHFDEWRFKKETFDKLLADNRIVFPKNGEGKPRYKYFLSEKSEKGVVANSWWDSDLIGSNQEAGREIVELFGEKTFDTPKPEKLIEYIITLSTQPGDLVFDAFGGSGTTFAVAHKMGRRYIGIEVGEHADTLILPRLQKVITGQDKGGISQKMGWQGGGGFSYYHLGESVLMQNTAGDWVLNPSIAAEELQRALLRYFDAPLQKSQGGWAYGHNGTDGYLLCLEDTDGNLTADEIKAAMVQLCPNDKPYLLTAFCLSASDSELDKLLKGCYPLPYALMPLGGEE